jgi:BMFP domain-containing protein YqiC
MAKSPFSFIKPEILSELSEQASKLLPSESSKEQIQQNLQTFLQGALTRLDLVSREEFDTQKAVLEKTRQKADALEQQVQALIEQLEKQSP